MTATSTITLLVLPAILLAVTYPMVVARFSTGLVSPYPKADVRRRFTAATIDALLCTTALSLFITLRSPAILVIGATYLLLRDAFGGQSVGKFFLSLVVVSVRTGQPCTIAGTVQRNFLLVVPGANVVAVYLEVRMILRDPQGQRLGDRLAQTQVVDGYGARELIRSVMDRLTSLAGQRGRVGRRRVRVG